IDEEGNWDFCGTYVDIQDNMGACDGREAQSAIVAGTIMDWKGNTVEAVAVTASNANTIMTPANGQYAFDLPMNADYMVTPIKDVQPLNGVSTFDLVLISKHILGITQFNNPHQYIAADVNQSGSITAFDMVQLRRLILNLDTQFTNNTSWKFVEAKYQFTTQNPAGEAFPTLSSVNNLAHDMEMDFTAVKIGDVNGNAKTNSLSTGVIRNTTATFSIETPNIDLVAGQQYTVNFTTSEMADIEGYQFTLGTGNLQFEQLTNGITSVDNFGLHRLDKGYLTTSWNAVGSQQSAVGSQQLFSIAFTATANGKLSEQLSLIQQPTAVEAYNTAGELLDVQLNFSNTIDLTTSFELYQNQPNPFVKATNISFFLPEQAEVVLTLRDEVGRLIKAIKAHKAAGLQSFSVNSTDLPKGLIFYQISSPFGTQTKKMLRVE
ncbi:MAG: dockerin type I domain-containing protein, partial [Saprospiraceae bacterium]